MERILEKQASYIKFKRFLFCVVNPVHELYSPYGPRNAVSAYVFVWAVIVRKNYQLNLNGVQLRCDGKCQRSADVQRQ